jgi:fatty acid desaturase
MGQTRTVRAGWLARLFIAPNRVQYHLEHHLLMTVPHYNLPRFHQMLAERGLLEGACVTDGYIQVLRQAVV